MIVPLFILPSSLQVINQFKKIIPCIQYLRAPLIRYTQQFQGIVKNAAFNIFVLYPIPSHLPVNPFKAAPESV